VAAALVTAGTSGLGSDSGSGAALGATQTVHAGPLALTLPAEWQWRILRGFYRYRGCTAPAFDLTLASYPRPALSVRQGGAPVVVPRNQLQLALGFAAIRTTATPWKHWRLTNGLLKPSPPVDQADPNGFSAEAILPRSAAITAVAFAGSNPMPTAVLAASNGVLRSIRVDRSYACR